jgi:hypothetical protein
MTRPKQLVMEPFDSLPESLRFKAPPLDLDHDEQLDAHWPDEPEGEEYDGLSE